MDRSNPASDIVWETRVPLVTNPFFLYDALKGVALAAAIFLGLMGGACAIQWDFEPWFAVARGMVFAVPALLALIALVCLVVFPRGFPASFRLGPKGVDWDFTGSRRGAAAAHLLSPARTTATGQLAWPRIRSIHEHPSRRVLCLRNSWRVVVRLYCLPENYSECAALVRERVSHHQGGSVS